MKAIRIVTIACCLIAGCGAALADGGRGSQEDIILDPKGGKTLSGTALGDLWVYVGETSGPGRLGVIRDDAGKLAYKIIHDGVEYAKLELEFKRRKARTVTITSTDSRLQVSVADQGRTPTRIRSYCDYKEYGSCQSAGMPGEMDGKLVRCTLYLTDETPGVPCSGEITLAKP